MGWKEKTDRAKRLHRPSLKDWSRDGLHSTFPRYAESVLRADPYRSFRVVVDNDATTDDGREDGGRRRSPWRVEESTLSAVEARRIGGGSGSGEDDNSADNSSSSCHGQRMLPVVLDPRRVSPAEFHERYEAREVPVVIRDLPFAGVEATAVVDMEEKKDDRDEGTAEGSSSSTRPAWPALHRWDLAALATDPDLRDRPLKVGEDDDGHTLRVKLRYFLRYLATNTDDSPLYIFDATFDEDRYAKRLLNDYTVPPGYFDEDLFGLVGERRRPPYRWWLVGPARSGTTVHIDPLGTSAWNTLVRGVKRWVLFPPHVPKSVVKGRRLILPKEDDEAVHYFCYILPRIKRRAAAVAAAGAKSSSLPEGYDYSDFECYEFNQYPGETVYIPHGWWHAVLNVSDSVGITQNYCSSRNFDVVWKKTRAGRKKMACTWLRKLGEERPDLARRARDLNRKDGFVMWEDDEDEQRRRRKKKADKERRRRDRSRAKNEKKERRREKDRFREELLRREEDEKQQGEVREQDNKRRSSDDDVAGGGDARAEGTGAAAGAAMMDRLSLSCRLSGGRESKRSRVEGGAMREVSPESM